MIYGSVCSGIEAATMAWHPLGWTPRFFSEIDKFPSAVLAHHYGSNMPGEALTKNGIPNYGDFTQIGSDAGPIDLLVGGTPCQSFSVAGKRLGLDDPRGNLALEYLALARRLNARWIVWENVPGVLSSRSGDEPTEEGEDGFESADFATFLSFVRECGYGFAYRVLDAQYVRVDGFARAVPQRRRRVFLVGYLGDWRPAAAVLLEPEGMRGDSAPSREAGKGIAGTTPVGINFSGQSLSTGSNSGVMPHEQGALLPIAFAQNTRDEVRLFGGDGQTVGTLAAEPGMKQQSYVATHSVAGTMESRQTSGGFSNSIDHAASGYMALNESSWAVRRLTPRECERLQGFPDDYTLVLNRGKPAADGPRYKALGNSMAVNAMRWIGMRIDHMEKILEARVAA